MAPAITFNLHKDNHEKLEQVFIAFKRAESSLKYVEMFGEADIPSINELRYVSYHVLEALRAPNAKQQWQELDKAERHCNRACFDAHELGMYGQLDLVADFQEKHEDFPISDVIPNYIDLLKKVVEAQSFCKKVSSSSREEYYDEVSKLLDILVDINTTLMVSNEEIQKRKQDREDAKKTQVIMEKRALAAEKRAEKAEQRAEETLKISKLRLKIAIGVAFGGVLAFVFKQNILTYFFV